MEKQKFPRFSIGESLLPHCMEFIEEAGMLEAVNAHGFQFKNGAVFQLDEQKTFFDFTEKFTEGPGTTFQVERSVFDKLLADQAQEQGVDIRYEYTITDVDIQSEYALVSYCDVEGAAGQVRAQFVLDASGFGRVLPRLLKLEKPSNFPVRRSLFTQVNDHILDPSYDRTKILVSINPNNREIWHWLIPYSDGRCSIGVVATEEEMKKRERESPLLQLQAFIGEIPHLEKLLIKAQFNYPVRSIVGYAANVSRLYGDRFALLGNAGEFLDPVFSSGVTIAMRSASMAANILHKQLKGEAVNWEQDYAKALVKGVDTFRVFVEAWYDGRFQDLLFFGAKSETVRDMISSILAGYAWDEKNPFVAQSERRMNTLVEICRLESASLSENK
jgi:flavin-dependent dehydrogenase